MDIMPIRAIVHYGMHFAVPFLLALIIFKKKKRLKASLTMIATMLVDLDHLLADPIFDPNRMSLGFHLLHSYYLIPLYVIMCFLPYKKMHLPWWLQAIGIGLTFHMITDAQDYLLWR